MATGDLLDRALDATPAARWTGLQGAHLLITGATGFFGQWLQQALHRLRQRGIDLTAQCVSRQRQSTNAPGLTWLRGGVEDFAHLPIHPGTTHVLHMAASSDSRDYAQNPLKGAQVILDGTVGALALAQRSGAHLHLVSSGAVYGARRLSMGPTQEAHITTGAPHPLERMSAYGNAKRMAEALVACASADYCISRPFAFLGPGLPLDQHFAAGNFVRDAATGQSIIVQGDGTPVRSYMHPADLAAWLLALLASPLRGQAINIGSSQPVSIAALAAEIAAQAGGPVPRIMGSPADGADPSAYWPDTTLAQSHGLSLAIDRHSAIADMLQWARNAAPTNHPSSLLTTP